MQIDLTKRSASRHSGISPRFLAVFEAIKELVEPPTIERLIPKYRTGDLSHEPQLQTTSNPIQDGFQTRPRNAGAQPVSPPTHPNNPSTHIPPQNNPLTLPSTFAQTHSPSPTMAQMTPLVRASGQGGIVISCSDPRVPCEQILGFDETISILTDNPKSSSKTS
jgi:hypothetical protein